MHLLDKFSADDAPRVAERWRISLEPPSSNRFEELEITVDGESERNR